MGCRMGEVSMGMRDLGGGQTGYMYHRGPGLSTSTTRSCVVACDCSHIVYSPEMANPSRCSQLTGSSLERREPML